jgi:DNA-binding beta-propeller fold protein YncE
MPQLTHVIQLDVDDRRPIIGVTAMDRDRLFVLRLPSRQQIEVYDTANFKLQETLSVTGLSENVWGGLAACVINNCLYVSDADKYFIYKVHLSVGGIMTWKAVGWPNELSVNSARNLLVACNNEKILAEYTPSGGLIRTIGLDLSDSMLGPWHAIQLTADQFVVCLHGGRWSSSDDYEPSRSVSDDIVEVNSEGRVVVSYKNQFMAKNSKDPFWRPYHLAVDENNECIYAADRFNRRIVILSRSLKCDRELNVSVDGSRITGPRCLILDASIDRLLVGEDLGCFFLFDLPPRLF